MPENLTLNKEQLEPLLKSPEQHKALPTAEQAEPLRPGEEDPAIRGERDGVVDGGGALVGEGLHAAPPAATSWMAATMLT